MSIETVVTATVGCSHHLVATGQNIPPNLVGRSRTVTYNANIRAKIHSEYFIGCWWSVFCRWRYVQCEQTSKWSWDDGLRSKPTYVHALLWWNSYLFHTNTDRQYTSNSVHEWIWKCGWGVGVKLAVVPGLTDLATLMTSITFTYKLNINKYTPHRTLGKHMEEVRKDACNTCFRRSNWSNCKHNLANIQIIKG
jgi:hypothetical protein